MTQTIAIAEYTGTEGTATLTLHKGPLNFNKWVLDGWGEWTEEFPTEAIATKRFVQLVELDLMPLGSGDRMFEKPYNQYLRDELGYEPSLEWKWRDYMNALAARGYETHLFNSGGGIILAETVLVDPVTHKPIFLLWADDHEGYPRFGLYAVKDDEVGDDCFMFDERSFDPQQMQTLDRQLALSAADLLDVLTRGLAAQV